MAAKRSVARLAEAEIAPAPPNQHERQQEGIVACEDVEVRRRVGEHLQCVGVDAADRLLDADDVVRGRESEESGTAESASGPVGDVVNDQRHR